MPCKTALYETHTALKAKMGAFEGYDLPLYYGEGAIKEHEWVRGSAGLFDVSHMGQIMLKGPSAQDFMQLLSLSSYEKLGESRTKYTVMLNEQGGIIDDLMVTKTGEDSFHLVVNAGCKDKDIAWIRRHLPKNMELIYFEDWALLALQGPKSEAALRDALGIDTADMPYMAMRPDKFKERDIYISRLGYTGEDGFEIAVHNDQASAMAEELLAHAAVKPVGLVARDSLRLEMGYCLYGHDIDEQTSPVEAGLNWVIGKDNTGFFGAERVLKERAEGPDRKRVGIKLLDKGIARDGAEIRNEEDEVIGALTSGGFSPSLKCSIGQGYVKSTYADIGTKLFVNIRGRNIAAEVVKMPFVPAKTKSMKKREAE